MGGRGKRFIPSPHSEKTKYIGGRRLGGGGGHKREAAKYTQGLCICLVQFDVSFSEYVVTKTQMEEYRVQDLDALSWVMVDGSHRSELFGWVVKPNV